MSRYSVLIDLNTSGVDELNKIERQILQLQTQGNKPINLKIDVDGNIKNITSMFDNIEKQAAQSGKNISKALQKGMKGFTFNSKDQQSVYKHAMQKELKQQELYDRDIEKMAQAREKSELNRKRREEAFIQAQNKAMNKSLEERQKTLASINKRANSGEFELRNAKIDAFESKYDGQNNDALNRVKNTIQEIKLLQTELQTGIINLVIKKV